MTMLATRSSPLFGSKRTASWTTLRLLMVAVMMVRAVSASNWCRVCQVDEDCLVTTNNITSDVDFTETNNDNDNATISSSSFVFSICDTERQLCVTNQSLVENHCPCSINDECATGRCEYDYTTAGDTPICQAKSQEYEGCLMDSDCLLGQCYTLESFCYNETVQGGPYQPWTQPPDYSPPPVVRVGGTNENQDDGSTDGALVALLAGSALIVFVIFVWCSHQTQRREDGKTPMLFEFYQCCCYSSSVTTTTGGSGSTVATGSSSGGGGDGDCCCCCCDNNGGGGGVDVGGGDCCCCCQ